MSVCMFSHLHEFGNYGKIVSGLCFNGCIVETHSDGDYRRVFIGKVHLI